MKELKRIKSKNEEELIKIAFDFSSFLQGNEIIFLNGELGAGKTTFSKGVAKALGVEEIVTSPTFTIIKDYEGKVCHVDAYRIFGEDIGIDYYIENNYLILIEWSKNIEGLEPDYIVDINYDDEGREVIIFG